jgi:hypothetical protein
VKKCALTLEYAVHEGSNWLRDGDNDDKENKNLGNANPSHDETSEFLGPQERVHQVGKQKHRNDSGNGVFHRFLLKPICGPRKAPEHSKKRDYDRDVEQIQHDHLWQHAPACLLSLRIVGLGS